MRQPPPIPLDRMIHRSAALPTRYEARVAASEGRVEMVAIHGSQPNPMPIDCNLLVDTTQHAVLLDGRPLPHPPPTVCLALHKPFAVLSTCAEEDGSEKRRGKFEGRTTSTVMQCLTPDAFVGAAPPPELRQVSHVGRLDADSEGLLLLTNDGSLTQGLLTPNACDKTYLAGISLRAFSHAAADVQALERATREAFADAISHLEDGVEIGQRGQPLLGWAESASLASSDEIAAAAAHFDDLPSAGSVLCKVVMRHGARRQVRRMLKAAGFTTVRLCRTSIGALSLDGLQAAGCRLRPGQWCVVPPGPALSSLYRAAAAAEGGSQAAFDSVRGQWVHIEELLDEMRTRDAG